MNGTREVPESGWRNENHGILGADSEAIISAWEAVHAAVPIDGLRWVLAHSFGTNAGHWDRFADMGAAINIIGGSGYQGGGASPSAISGTTGSSRGGGADSPDVAPLNPWQNVSFAVTGRNVRGELTNDG